MPAKTTGRYATRWELVDALCRYYYNTSKSLAQTARFCGISDPTARKIIDGKEGDRWRRRRREERWSQSLKRS